MPTQILVTGRLSIEADPGPRVELVFAGKELTIDLAHLPTRQEMQYFAALAQASAPARATGHGSIGVNEPDAAVATAPPRATTAGPVSGYERRRAAVHKIDGVLRQMGFDVELRVAGRPIGRIGPHARATMSARLLGLDPLEIHAMPALLAWLRW